MKRFSALWISQVLSGTGSLLTSFSIGIWVFQRSGSVIEYSLILFFTILPSLFLSPVTGAVIDRSSRKRVMLWSDAGAALCNLALMLCLLEFEISLPIIFIFLSVSASFASFQWPAYSSWVSLLVAEEDFGRAGGWLKLGEGIPFLVAPLAGGVIYGNWGLKAVLAIDLVTFLVSMLIVLSIPTDSRPAAGRSVWSGKELIREARDAFTFIRDNSGLGWLLGMSFLVIFAESWTIAVFQPYLLLFLQPKQLGVILAIGGTGIFTGGLLMAKWGGPKRQIKNVVGFISLQAVVILLLGILPVGYFGISVLTFFYFACIPFFAGSNQAIWLKRVPIRLQGRVFSIRRGIESVSSPAAFLLAGIVSPPLTAWLKTSMLPILPDAIPRHAWSGRELGLTFLFPGAIMLCSIFTVCLVSSFRSVDVATVPEIERT